MLYAVGSRVKLLHSRDQGVVTALLDNGMVEVHLDEYDMEIPVAPEDLILVQEPSKKTKAKILPAKKKKIIVAPPKAVIETQYQVIKGKGIQLAFDPDLNLDGMPSHYDVYLINDKGFDILYDIRLSLHDNVFLKGTARLSAMSCILLGELPYGYLNEQPLVELDIRRILSDGTGPRNFKKFKIRPKQFFKNLTTAPIINREAHLYKVFEKLSDKRRLPGQKEDLKTYTRKNARPLTSGHKSFEDLPNEIVEFAEFIPEIDLHIEELVEDYSNLDNLQIIQLQLRVCEEYLEKAIRLGVDRVYLIHGVGKGRLKDAIATRLLQNPYVKTFKNEYHPRYGYGATEVIIE